MILRIYDYFSKHKPMLFASLALITVVLVASVVRLSYKEDISDFLPVGTSDRESLAVYQNISGANRLFVVFRNTADADSTISQIDYFEERVRERDTLGWCSDLTTKFDLDKLSETSEFVYGNIPYFLTDADYSRMDSLLAQPDFVRQRMAADREMLLFPTGDLLSENMSKDPLGLFAPVVSSLHGASGNMKFEMHDGYIFTPDMSRAIVMLTSPFGNSETDMNARLTELLKQSVDDTRKAFPETDATVVGGPEIAVGNASQIKTDSLIAVALTSVLIMWLLLYSLRSVRNIVLILFSVGWGWLFALGAIALLNDSASIIVIGISSVILGIAVNYPLHLIVHSGHERNVRSAMKEIFVPLVIGNITTVGAFMALVPLQSTALRDLGLFASFLLVGTILFVVVYLPHFVKIKTAGSETKMLNLLARFCPEEYRGIVRLVVILTLVFGWFSFGAEFDSNMANINYMTDEQRSEMAYFQQILSGDSATNVQTVYVVSSDSTFDGALAESQKKQSAIDSLVSAGTVASHAGVRQFIASESEQNRRLERWKRFVGEHRDVFGRVLSEESVKAGFSADAFSEFQMLVADTASLSAKPFEYFAPLTQQVFSGNLSFDKETSKCAVVDILKVDESRVSEVEALFSHSFDVQSMNSAISDSLSDNFNYIGWACSLIVFFFLWFSFGRIELAILSFLPMAVSWVWILGIMAIFGIKFNIVNIILATFIFGQGDDYTIFMTEGCQSEYAYRKPILASYKSSIIQSALIMFVGIGTLVVAKHPALFSLAIVTIIGMFCVVFMAYLLPPLLFGIVTAPKRPVSLASACRTLLLGILLVVEMPLIAMLRPMRMSLRNSGFSLLHRFNLRLLFGVKIKRIKAADDAFGKSSVVVFNHRSMLDAMLIVALNRNIILKSKMPESIWQKIFLWLCGCSCDNVDVLLGAGCSVALLTDEASACEVAKTLKTDILPVVIHGSDKIISDESLVINGGTVTISVEKKVSYSDSSVPEKISARYDELCRNIENSSYFVLFVKDLYMYRGVDIMRSVNRNLRRNGNYSAIVDAPVSAAKVVIDGVGYGEAALLFALVHPDVQVVAVEADADKRTVAQNCIGEVAPNVEVVESCLADDSALVINLKK